MNLKVFKYYISVCSLTKTQPTFNGLHQFAKFYYWECENNGKESKLGESSSRYE